METVIRAEQDGLIPKDEIDFYKKNPETFIINMRKNRYILVSLSWQSRMDFSTVIMIIIEYDKQEQGKDGGKRN